MICMLVLNHEVVIEDRETLDLVLEGMKSQSYNQTTDEAYEVFEEYMNECFAADIRLTEMTQQKLGNDLYPLVFIDCDECSDLNAFNFSLSSENENREVKFMEEKLYYKFCDICFGQILGLFDRIYLHFET